MFGGAAARSLRRRRSGCFLLPLRSLSYSFSHCSLSALAIFAPSQKWSKGKVKEKLANLVLFDKTTYEKMLTDVPKQKLITPSIISAKLKVNGSLARKAVRELVSKGLIRPVLTHKQQQIFTRATNQ